MTGGEKKKQALILAAALALFCCFVAPASSDTLSQPSFTDEPLDDEEEDFVDEEEWEVESSELDNDLSGIGWRSYTAPAHFTYRHELGYGVKDPKKLVINRSSLRLQWERGFGKHYFLRLDTKAAYDFVYDRDEFDGALRDEYQYQDDVRELFLQASFGKASIKFGKQLAIWGKADGAVVTDIMSPRDLTESVFTSVEDARRGQSMIVVDYYPQAFTDAETGVTQQTQWTLIINPDVKVNEFAEPGHPYSFADFGVISGLNIIEDKPEFSWEKPEVGIRWGKSFGKFDFALMAAEVTEDNPVVKQNTSRLNTLEIDYPRYEMIGGGFNAGAGNWVWKGEAAFKHNKEFNRTDRIDPSQHLVWDLAFGFDYDANGAYTASVELTNQHIVQWRKELLNVRKDEPSVYGTWRKNWLNETLVSQYTASLHLRDKDSFHRFELIYDMTDQWTIETQLDYFITHRKESILGQLEDKHRLGVEVTFDF